MRSIGHVHFNRPFHKYQLLPECTIQEFKNTLTVRTWEAPFPKLAKLLPEIKKI